jgi:hypothetical protein
MKHIVLIFFLPFFAGLFNSVYSQSLCANISVEAFPMNPQTGSFNYFGVRVTLDQAYSQDITVSGYIFNDGDGQDQNNPYTITILAGNVTNETTVSFFQTNPTAIAVVNTTAIAPSVVSAGGTYYNTSCNQSVEDQLNIIGQLHNDYQDSLFSYIVNSNFDISDTSSLRTLIQAKQDEFSNARGFSVSSAAFTWNKSISNIGYSSYTYSTSGTTILSSLNSLINNLNSSNESTFTSSVSSLLSSALQLPNIDEKYKIGIPLVVAINSYNYWTEKQQEWGDAIFDQIDNRTSYENVSPVFKQFNESSTINFRYPNAAINTDLPLINELYNEGISGDELLIQTNFHNFFKYVPNKVKIIRADVSGAIEGAIGGAAFGLGGSLAVGLMNSAGGSACEILNQIMDQKYSWWPF